MPTYKLYYFEARARAEATRFAFAEAGVPFEDIRIKFDDWPKTKPNMPLKELPVLEVDGKQLCQSYAILRYVAKEFGLAGKGNWEEAQADQFVGAIEDLFQPTAMYNFRTEESKKPEALKKLKEETAPKILQFFENALSKSTSGFLVGNGVTYADFNLVCLQDFVEGLLKENAKTIFSPFPKIQSHRQKILSRPKIAAWIKKRPATDF